jgi:hypothetical protein
MDTEDSLVQKIEELDSEQAEVIDGLIGKKIWNIEIIEDENDSAIKIQFSEAEGDYILIYGQNMDMYVLNPKPSVTH